MEKTVIRKYNDRRLYDSAGKRYVKLEDVARMVRDGVEIEVVDAASGRDITRVVLMQIIVEQSRDQETGLPLQLLRHIVMAPDRAAHEILSRYLSGTLELYQKAQEEIRSRISDARQAVTAPLDFVRSLLAPEAAEVDQLRRRVKELEARLAELTSADPPPPARRKTRRRPPAVGRSATGRRTSKSPKDSPAAGHR